MGPTHRRRSNTGPITAPTDLPNCALWLDGADADTQTVNGSNLLASWLDKSGNTRTATQSSDAIKPTVHPTGQNGKGTVAFQYLGVTGTASRMTCANAISTTASTIIIVHKCPARVNTTEVLLSQGIGTLRRGSSGGEEVISYVAGGSTDGVDALQAADGPALDKFVITSTRRSAAQNHIELRENFAVIKSTTYTYSTALASAQIRLGWDTAGNYGNVEFAEIIIYDRYLSTAELLQVENYLNDKWAVYTNFAERRAHTDGVQKYCTLNNITAENQLPPSQLAVGMAGQSNNGGEAAIADLPGYLKVLITGALMCQPITFAFETLTVGPPQNNLPNSGVDTKHGPEMELLFKLAEKFGTINCIKHSAGGTSMEQYWKPSLASSEWTVFKNLLKNSRYKLGKTTGIELIIIGLFFYQGENDTTASYAPLYQDSQMALIIDFRTTVPLAEDAIVVLPYVNSTAPTAYTAQVNAAKQYCADNMTDVIAIPGWTTAIDSVHADSASQVVIGYNAAVAFGADA